MVRHRSARRSAVNVRFYPVVDVNNNPPNPIINIGRSRGPARRSEMALAYIKASSRRRLSPP